MSEGDLPNTLEEALEIIRHQRIQIAEQARLIESMQWAERDRERPGSVRAGLGSRLRQALAHRLRRRAEVEILESGLFDTGYYRETVRNRRDARQALKNPLKHYLRVGGLEGLNPSEYFDSGWYLANNADVRASGLNPLLHYVQFGRHEGRMPFSGSPTWIPGKPKHVSDFNARLWGGFSHVALPELEALADSGLNPRAAWYLAAWYYVHGDAATALQCVKKSVVQAPRGATKEAFVGLAKCYTQLEDYTGLISLLEDPSYTEDLGEVYPYVQASLFSGQDRATEALTAMNGIFSRAGLAGIGRVDTSRPLALDNLRGLVNLQGIPVTLADMPLLSVVVPAYNAGSTLHVALEGLLAQSWRNLEIIIVDDGSTDNTAQVAEAYVKKDSRVRYLPNSTNIGAYPTRNNGMRAAKGEFVTVHDSDDWSHPQKLERQIQPLLNDPSKAATLSSWARVTADMRFVGPWLLSSAYVEKNHSSIILRRALLEDIGYWDEVNVAGDTEFLWRLEQALDPQSIVHILPLTPLSFALADDASLTRTKATHVKTIHYGLRRIYREAARWWHRQAVERPVLESGSRPFPVPLGIVRGAGSRFDAVLAADMSAEGRGLDELLAAFSAALSRFDRVCVLHWPSYSRRHGAPVADAVFALCQSKRLCFAHAGITVNATVVRMLDGSFEDKRPCQTVKVPSVKRIENSNGDVCEFQDQLLEYFRAGGTQSEF